MTVQACHYDRPWNVPTKSDGTHRIKGFVRFIKVQVIVGLTLLSCYVFDT